jgi:SAM-dependent methyltransferase
MEDFSLLIDLHVRSQRQGPGGNAETRKALELVDLHTTKPFRVLDIGCGTGASTLQLAHCLDAEITALDLSADFLEVLANNARTEAVSEKITPLVGDMESLPFTDGAFDLIWSEGAVYNMGFERGVTAWRRLLAPGGSLVVSEITWTTSTRPRELQEYWEIQYSEIDSAGAKISTLEQCGYSPVAYFVLPERCWLDNYYLPLQDSFPAFLARHRDDPRAAAIIDAEEKEIAFYKTYKPYYSYGVYVARKN